MLTTFNYIILLSPKAIIMLSQHSFEKVFDAKLNTWLLAVTPSATWRRALCSVRLYVYNISGLEHQQYLKSIQNCYFFIAENPLAINVWLRFAISNSTHYTKTNPTNCTNGASERERVEEKIKNYLCKQQTYQQIWIMQKLNLVHIIKVEQKTWLETYCVSINTCFTARLHNWQNSA